MESVVVVIKLKYSQTKWYLFSTSNEFGHITNFTHNTGEEIFTHKPAAQENWPLDTRLVSEGIREWFPLHYTGGLHHRC